MKTRPWQSMVVAALAVMGCSSMGSAASQAAPFNVTVMAQFNEPWALAFLPDGRVLVSEKRGVLQLYDLVSDRSTEIAGVPTVAYGGQGGFGDVVLHPDFASNQWLYLSYAEAGPDYTAGAVVARTQLVLDTNGGGRLTDMEVLWRQVPKVSGQGHYGHRIAFGPDGYLWISSGERQQLDPAQDLQANLGKIVRLHDDGSVPADNPFVGRSDARGEIWSLGHRNPLGLAFDANGLLWNVEMGPRGGDELNRVRRGANFGYPLVSDGDHYSGKPIPDHSTRPEFAAPAISWTPVISPSSLLFYSGSAFPAWRGSAFISGLSSQALIRVEFTGETAREVERFALGQRIRAVAQGPDGTLWLLTDGRSGGELQRLTPADTRLARK